MLILVFMFLTSIVCLFCSLLALGLVVKLLYSKDEKFESSSRKEAIVISGCDSGIGFELAKHFFKSSELTLICGFLNPDSSLGHKELTKLSETVGKERIYLERLNITCDADIEQLVSLIEGLKSEGVIDHVAALINNAGTMTFGEFDWLTWDHIQSQVNVNFLGTIRLTRALLPHLIESKGRIVNVSSVNDATVFPGLTIYSATKSALSTFSRGLGYELRKFGVLVITVRLGDFARLTNIMAKHEANQDDMWNEMNSRKQSMYKDFFQEFNKHLLQNYGMTSPREFEESSLFKDFRRAILSKNPPSTITCAPLGFKVFYLVVELLPVWLQYRVLDVLIQVGFRWRPPRVIV